MFPFKCSDRRAGFEPALSIMILRFTELRKLQRSGYTPEYPTQPCSHYTVGRVSHNAAAGQTWLILVSNIPSHDKNRVGRGREVDWQLNRSSPIYNC